jgi:hypothetical protein
MGVSAAEPGKRQAQQREALIVAPESEIARMPTVVVPIMDHSYRVNGNRHGEQQLRALSD